MIIRVRMSLGIVAGVVSSLAIASSALGASISWSNPKNLDTRNGVYLADAEFAGNAVAVVWGQPYDDPPNVRVKSSDDAGATFSSMAVFDNATDSAVTICDDHVYVAYVSHTGQGRWVVDVAVSEIGRNAFVVKRAIGGRGIRHAPDIACTDGRLFISWYQREGGPARRWVTNSLLTTLEFGRPVDLGLDRTNYDGYYSPRGFRLAASGNTAYAVFGSSDGRLRLKRWSIGAAPDHPVTPRPVVIVGQGTNKCPAEFPVIGVDDNTVAVAWERNSGILARVSTDRGASWGPVRDLSGFDCGGIVDGGAGAGSIAVEGARMVIEVGGCGFGYCSNTVLLTRDAFAHHSWTSLWDGRERSQQSHLVGYVTVAGKTRLADAYANGERVRFRRAT